MLKESSSLVTPNCSPFKIYKKVYYKCGTIRLLKKNKKDLK